MKLFNPSSVFKKKPDKKKSEINGAQLAPYAAKYEKSAVAEAFKILRTNLQFSIKFNEPRVIVITSPNQMEGKTTVASNLGVTFAAANYNTLVLDADMRIPNLHRQFGMENKEGLSNCLNGDCDLERAIQTTPIDNLSLMGSGPIPFNSSELLSSDRMIKLLEELKSRYQLIIIDSPPVNVVADTPIVSTLSDGLLVVISMGNTRRRDLKKTLHALDYCNILGFVLNVTRRGNESYYQYYSSRYYAARK